MDKRVFWITGLSGAGKTTIGMALYYRLKTMADNVVILDGDALREALGSGGYTHEDRHQRAFQYARLCKLLSEQGIVVICCTIAMFEDVRGWNRRHIDGYIEIFLDVPHEVLVNRDNKQIYSQYQNGQQHHVAGFDLEVEFPKHPDMVLCNDGSLSVAHCVNEILTLSIASQTPIAQDLHYWNNYYKQQLAEEQPSPFAQYVLTKLNHGEALIDLGCGNGRDALYFHWQGLKVTAVDQSPAAIAIIKKAEPLGITCICGDIANMNALCLTPNGYHHCYSRFSVHALSDEQQDALIAGVYALLQSGGAFWIEARSIHDTLFGKGSPAGRNAFFYTGHYRRFIVLDEFIESLEKHGFRIEQAQEAADFAPYRGENPVVIRVLAVKP